MPLILFSYTKITLDNYDVYHKIDEASQWLCTISIPSLNKRYCSNEGAMNLKIPSSVS
jgi:hypothetical protein